MSFDEKKLAEQTNILIVEDSLTQAIQLRSVLEKHGFRAACVQNGAQGLKILKEADFDMIVSDVIMPEMDGYALCRKIKDDEVLKGVPVILLTTLSEPEDIVKGLESGADHFITKPYDENSLISRIRYILLNQQVRKNQGANIGLEIYFAGKKHFINSDRMQILDLLFSTYENVLRQKRELERLNNELRTATGTIKKLEGILPICANCKKIRDKNNNWHVLECYIKEHSQAEFSHGICPECAKKLYPEFKIFS
jgi:two-component system, OmpR family, response regulator VanR